MSHQDDVYVRNFGAIKIRLEQLESENADRQHEISGLQNLIVQQRQLITDLERQLNITTRGKVLGSTVHN